MDRALEITQQLNYLREDIPRRRKELEEVVEFAQVRGAELEGLVRYARRLEDELAQLKKG